MRKVNLILSGGAGRGIAHIGVIKALEDLGFKINAISGVSAGALVAVFYAYGYSPEDMLQLVKETPWLSLFRPRFPTRGLFSFDRAGAYLKDLIRVNRIEELGKKVYICAVDLRSSRPLYFDRGDLLPILLGSCAIPGVFEPVEYGDYLFIDGGIMNNLPVEPFERSRILKVGVDVNPVGQMVASPTVVSILLRSFLLAFRSNVDKRKELCNVVIEPELENYSPLDLHKADELYRIGYKKTLEVMEGLIK